LLNAAADFQDMLKRATDSNAAPATSDSADSVESSAEPEVPEDQASAEQPQQPQLESPKVTADTINELD